MNYRLPPLNALRAFEVAARHLSFTKAGEELAVTPTAISHQIRGLEDYLGFPLFRRLTRALELTVEGKAMLPKVREGIECFAAAIENARSHKPGGRLLVVSPPAFASRWLIPHLPSFSAEHPEITLHMSASVKVIDPKGSSGISGLEGFDPRDDEPEIFVRFGHGRYAGCRTDRLFAPAYTAVCSPSLMTGERPLKTPSDLRHHVLIHDDTVPELMGRPTWSEWMHIAGVTGIDAEAGMHFSDLGLVLSAAVDGVGVALASQPLVAAEIAAGRLMVPFDIVIRRPQAYYLVAPEAVAERPVVRTFREWILSEVAKMPSEQAASAAN